MVAARKEGGVGRRLALVEAAITTKSITVGQSESGI